MDRGAWRATVHGLTESQDMTEGLTLSFNVNSLEFLVLIMNEHFLLLLL